MVIVALALLLWILIRQSMYYAVYHVDKVPGTPVIESYESSAILSDLSPVPVSGAPSYDHLSPVPVSNVKY